MLNGNGPSFVSLLTRKFTGTVQRWSGTPSQLYVDCDCSVKVTACLLVYAKNGWMKAWLNVGRSVLPVFAIENCWLTSAPIVHPPVWVEADRRRTDEPLAPAEERVGRHREAEDRADAPGEASTAGR